MEAFTTYVLPYINLAIFLFLIIKFARQPMNTFLANRKEKFVTDYNEAHKLLIEAEAQSDAINKRLASLDKEILSINQRAAAVATQEVQRVLDNAQRLSVHFKDEVSRIADAEVNQAVADLKNEIINGVLKQVKQKLSEELDDSTQQQLIEKNNKKLVSMDNVKYADDPSDGLSVKKKIEMKANPNVGDH